MKPGEFIRYTSTAMKQPKKTKAMLVIPLAFKEITIGSHEAKVPITALRCDLSIADAANHLCGRQLTGTILARPEGAGATQNGLFGEDGDVKIAGSFKCRQFTVKHDRIVATLHIERTDAIDANVLLGFSKREGLLTIDALADLPEVKAAAAGGEGDEVEDDE